MGSSSAHAKLAWGIDFRDYVSARLTRGEARLDRIRVHGEETT